MRWGEGPVWFGDGRYLLWSDIPNNRIMRWDEDDRRRQRLPQAGEQLQRQHARPAGPARHLRARRPPRDAHRVRRRHHRDRRRATTASRSTRRTTSSARSDGSIWFTDPPFGILGFYEGHVAEPELPTNVYRWDPTTKKLAVVVGDVDRPNGLAFSPDESNALRRAKPAAPRG